MVHTAKKYIAIKRATGVLLVLMTSVTAGKTFGAAQSSRAWLPSMDHHVVRVGTAAPGFSLKSTDGKTYSLEQYRGHGVLLSFIDIRDFKQTRLSQEMRSQLTFLRSIYHQFEKDGLKVILIDAPGLRGEKATDKDVLINFMNDNEVQDWPLLSGKAASQVVARYGVGVLPTTILVNRQGMVSQVWEHLALSGQLALAVENIPVAVDSSVSWDTPSQTIFPGFGPARKLSPTLWIVDEGRMWKREHYPIRLLSTDNRARWVRVTAISGSGEELLVDTLMEKLDGSRVLMHNMPKPGTSVYSVLSIVSPGDAGRYQLKATVFDKEHHMISCGAARVTVAKE